ncbi:hypothetical protein QR680_018676 [Steinernema hermaphroditum]|uniref:ubiquitinyl hydrolase 1 n=1 Tax=Steinernema hermaphroditum TaxID=289476 RepID=A0AA39HIP7_9BILA|nr:hypothetical protein QR680_018676 [Steinernema hermaphroditum]
MLTESSKKSPDEDAEEQYPFREIVVDESKPQYVLQGVCGLWNYGATCYMNSALQCLVAIPELTQFFAQRRYREELNITSKKFEGQLAVAYKALLEEMEAANGAIVPDGLRNLIKKYEGRFNNNEQQDAQEFLSFFLDELHEDLNRVVKKPYIEYSESILQTHAEMGREAWENHRKREDSVVVDLAHLQVKYKRTCTTCSTESVRFESAASLTLELPEEEMFSPHISLFDCIEKHTSEELLGEDNAWFCPQCQKMQEAKLKTDLWKLPKILILHLKRFRFCGNANSKIESTVTFPLKGFKLLDNSEDETCVYDLVGVCNHVGSDVNNGHYTAMRCLIYPTKSPQRKRTFLSTVAVEKKIQP